ncbi:MAG: chemotaxis protein CheW [Proteobacteria bacterium]|nr:chemotaxis protein CheW [Pseudomonadota bacterium]MBU4294434.1 chemotaxis protein CheW [Pseudomonadota bacterium]MCG2747616.1 chemotaxis protein CheW [Desulfobulbaceae bacterium]
MSATDDAILDELIIESKEHLEKIEPNLLALEKEGGMVSSEIINTIFRAIHSIKGGFGFYGLKNIQALSHAMESVLMQVRDGKLAITPTMTDALLAGVDKLRLMLDDAKASETCSIEADCNRLLQLLQDGALPAPPVVEKNAQESPDAVSVDRFGLTAEQICDRIRNGQHLYHLSILCPADLGGRNRNGAQLLTSLAEIGDIIAADPPQADIAALTGEEEQPATLTILYATVLDQDFLAKTMGLADGQCVTASIAAHGKKAQEVPAGQPQESGEATAALRKPKKQEKVETIRVKVSLLNNLMALAGELVLGRNQMKQALNRKISSALSSTASLKRFEAGLVNSRKVLHSSLQSDPRLKDENKKNDRLLASVDRELGQILNNFRYSLGFNLIDMPGISGLMQNVDLVTSKLQNTIMNTRMQPIDAVFSKFPRIIRDMAKKLGKEIQLTVEGSDVELDKSVIETLGDPLTHLIRNCADHGIETPEVRIAAGKTSFGKIFLRAHHEAGLVNIDIIDDGAGLDVERIVEKAISTGCITREEAAMLTEQEAMALILTPGLSTAKVVSDVSGRGVGMDVVRTNIEKLGGEVVIDSTPGKGTRINLKLPLTLAIIPSLIISTGGRTFAVPQVNMEELVRIRAQDIDAKIEEIQNNPVLRLRNKLLPLIRLDETLGMERTFVDSKGVRRPDLRQGIIDRRGSSTDSDDENPTETEKEMQDRRQLPPRRERSSNALNILVLKVGTDRYGLIVERLFDNEEIVVKPLSSYFSNCHFYCGTTIMGDGRVAMILDAAGIAEAARLRFTDAIKKEGALQADRFQREAMRESQSLLLFRNGTGELFAVNLAMVARIEKIHTSSIRQIGSLEYITHEDSSMRILRLHHFLPVQEPTATPETFYVIIPKLVSDPMGIVADKIVDIIATSEEINRKTIRGTGIIGSLLLAEGLIVVLNIYSLFEAADPDRAKAEIAHVNLRGLRVLLAEDTGFFRTVIHNYLESVGYEVTVANDGLEAWEMLGQGEYDLLVTDIVMPGLDGIELTERVRDAAAFSHMPVIALTSLMGESDRARIMAAGVDAYETKLDREHLLQTIGEVMAARPDRHLPPAGGR